MLIDTHCHLNYPGLSEDVDGVLARAAANGVTRIIVPGTAADTSASAVALSERHDNVFAAVGVHPTDGDDSSEEADFTALAALVTNPKVVAVGEVGLDYFHVPADAEAQAAEKRKQSIRFSRYIELAKTAGKPLIIHSRDCFDDLYAQLKSEGAGVPFVIHCFTGTMEDMYAWLDLGGLVSFTGIITYRKNDALRAVAAAVPLGCFMVETDAPYLAPEGFRGQTCEPRFTRNVAECLAAVRATTLEEIATQTTATAERFFNLSHA